MVAFQPEVLYSQKGAELKGGALEGFTFKLNSLDLPIFFRYTLADGAGPFVQAGPPVG